MCLPRVRAIARKRPKSRASGERRVRRTIAARAESSRGGDDPLTDRILDEGLTRQEFIFVEELCANPTAPASDAARKAYPDQNEDAVRVTACRLTRDNEKVKAAIRRRLLPSVRKHRAGREVVMGQLGEALHADRRRIVGPNGGVLPFEQWPPDVARLCTGFDHEELKVGDTIIGRVLKPRFANLDEHGGAREQDARVSRLTTPSAARIDSSAPASARMRTRAE
jgi:hypothetical protein